jgi:hypothetical protein
MIGVCVCTALLEFLQNQKDSWRRGDLIGGLNRRL